MIIKKQTSPYIRKETSTKRMMLDVIIALLPVTGFAIYRFGMGALIRILLAVFIMIALELLFVGLFSKTREGNSFKEKFLSSYKNVSINNITAPAVTGLIYALLLPDKISLYVVVIGSIFAIVVTKMLFGGLGANLFNPAASGRIFASVALGGFFTTQAYTGIVSGSTALGIGGGFDNALAVYSLKDLFLGNVPGTMGEISALAILMGLAYLLIRRAADFRVVLAGLGSFVLLIFFAGLKIANGRVLEYVLFHVLSGGLLFGLTFMVTDPVTSPVTRPGRVLYGMLIGVLVVLVRLFGSFPEGMAFAILIGNAFVPLIDLPKWSNNKYKPMFVVAMAVAMAILSLVVYLAV